MSNIKNNIVFYRKNGKIIRYKVSGHTGKAEYGKDILCSAISTAVQTIAVGITEILNLEPKLKIDDGYFELEMKEKDVDNQNVQILLETGLKSLKEIVKNEKKFVKLEEKNEIV